MPPPALRRIWQGRRESNSQPLVLETSALPIELRPSIKLFPSGHPLGTVPVVTPTHFLGD